jgi:hypothetical protein
VTTTVVQETNAQGKIEWSVQINKTEVAPTKVVVGTVTVTAPGEGNFTVTVAAQGGTCSAPVCPSGVVAPGAPVVCTITCTEGTTGVTPALVIDNAPPFVGANTNVDWQTFKAPTACALIDSSFFAKWGPSAGQRGVWAAKKYCDTDADATVTRPIPMTTGVPPPGPGQCDACAPAYNITALVTAVSQSTNQTLAVSTADVSKPCPGYAAAACGGGSRPTAADDAFTCAYNGAAPAPCSPAAVPGGVLANDQSNSNGTLTVDAIVAPPASGTVNFTAAGDITFTPAA